MDRTHAHADARASLTQDAKALNLVEFWEQRADVELLQPRNKAKPYRWKWTDIEPRLRVASKTVPIEECERRVPANSVPDVLRERPDARDAGRRIDVGEPPEPGLESGVEKRALPGGELIVIAHEGSGESEFDSTGSASSTEIVPCIRPAEPGRGDTRPWGEGCDDQV